MNIVIVDLLSRNKKSIAFCRYLYYNMVVILLKSLGCILTLYSKEEGSYPHRVFKAIKSPLIYNQLIAYITNVLLSYLDS